ncbi:phosphatase PAP2 family protein [Legionella jamestowniensis]|uniref:PAP2 superfamily protein n=1 Tax=Legionella jamestowniensis TaxID=455 RepID=A0A0W0UIL9_9GAMM|nr:phosphatase PAP2 family protein [Legionella jamestowniensis]KTD07559.1 PAP2 superfamily protein [Legionella jamestowniensis]OCH97673.1 hypothetical protein A8135_02210 [Legionella jamestowniensis]SFM01747.1 undecaprenyl-diphosphatase [Legionella jamestowniensis DSM 19215]
MLDALSQFFLLFSNGIVIVPFLIIGLICLDRNLYYQAICLVLISSIINVALKVSFQVPLSPSLAKNWFAFPSGHMQMAAVLYGWIAYKTNIRGIKAVTAILLTGIALSLMHFNYHNVYDIAGALFFALIILGLYQVVYVQWEKLMPWFLMATAVGLIFYIKVMYGQIPSHCWIAFYGLSGLVIGKIVCSLKAS